MAEEITVLPLRQTNAATKKSRPFTWKTPTERVAVEIAELRRQANIEDVGSPELTEESTAVCTNDAAAGAAGVCSCTKCCLRNDVKRKCVPRPCLRALVGGDSTGRRVCGWAVEAVW